jgi:hypothetical protein
VQSVTVSTSLAIHNPTRIPIPTGGRNEKLGLGSAASPLYTPTETPPLLPIPTPIADYSFGEAIRFDSLLIIISKEGNRVMERCTAEHKSATDGERCTTEPMEATRGDALLKIKAQEEIRPHQEQEKQDFPNPSATDVVSVAAAVEVTEPMVVDLAKAAVSEPQAEGGIQEAVSEPQAEHTDGYEDQAEDDNEYDAEYDDEGDYEDDAEYDDEAEGEDDYDYGSDYEEEEYDYGPLFEEERPKVRAVLSHFPETANLEPHELDAAVERILEQSKP